MTDRNDSPALPTQAVIPICSIGASAGGVSALQSLFRQLPDDLGLAYVVIVHLSPDQPSALSEILSVCTRMPVLQVEDGPTLKANCVYVIPPDHELVIDEDRVTARPFTQPRGHRAPIDMFFRSVAAARGDGIAVVLSGAGADGTNGVRSIKEAGGVVMVQEPAEAGFPSMPQNAIATGFADFVAPVARLAERIGEVARSKDAVRSLDMDGGANELRRIVSFLRTRTGHDFASYKRATVMRRVTRRMQVCHADTLAAYANYLYATPEEAKELFSDLLISVTMFFRDPRAFEALERHVVQPLFDTHDDDGIRAWVVGCATGEEAYSLAILVLEEASRRNVQVPIQIFASDLDGGALLTARDGRYPRTIEADVSEERLRRFFVDDGTHYRISKKVRDVVLFTSHNVLKDPPFMRLDLITCRNLLIYLERSQQQQLCSIFHYGLKPGRFLFLGSAETADITPDLFAVLDRDARLYHGRPHTAYSLPVLPQFPSPERNWDVQLAPSGRSGHGGAPGTLHAAALESHAPPSALVDEGHAILHLSPTVGRFILHSAGPFSGRLAAVVRPELRLDLKLALTRATEQSLPTITHPVVVDLDGDRRRVLMHVVPVQSGDRMARQGLAFFLDCGPAEALDEPDRPDEMRPDEVRRLHGELKAAQEALIASRGGHEASIQDLRAANEELQSINEEYRSTAEELETSKEELQSINEELQTVNAELKSKLESISVAHNDLQNLTAATEVGTLFLDARLRIKMFTARISDLFNITANDIGRTITDFTHRLQDGGVESDARTVLRDLAPIEREVQDRNGRWHVMRLRPYRTVENRIDGIVLTFFDITARIETEAKLSESEQQLRALIQASSQVLYRMSPDWNETRELSGGGFLPDTDKPSGSWLDRYIPEDEQTRVRAVIRHAIQTKGVFELEHQVRRIDGTLGWTQSRAIPVLDEDGEIVEWFGSATNVTERRQAEDALRDSEERQRMLIEGVPQLVWRAVEAGHWTWSSPQWHDYTGLSEQSSRDYGWLTAVHPDDHARVMAVWQSAEESHVFEVDYRIAHLGDRRFRWFQSRAKPLIDRDGRVVEWVGTSTDVDDLRRLQESQALMVAELQHRTRNLIAVVRSIADQTMASSDEMDEFRAAFSDRLAALSRVQGLLSRADREPITIGTLVRTELDALGAAAQSGRVTIVGPEVALRNEAVQTLALALHELATNAVKYGALSTEHGQLSVAWNRYEDSAGGQRLALQWIERGIAGAGNGAAPLRDDGGYGRELIERALPYALGARTRYDLRDDGVACSVDLPLTGDAADLRLSR